MAFRFNNPLRQIANTQAQINRGIGQFGQVSTALAQFKDVQQNIGRISSSIGQITQNAGSLQGIIGNVQSAGDVLNTLGGNSSLQNTFRSVSALTRDVQNLMPGNSRVLAGATTISKRAEDLFSNVQRNIQGIESITGGVTDVLNGTLDVGNLAGRSLGPLTGGLNLGQLTNGLPGLGNARNLLGSASGLQSTLRNVGGALGQASISPNISSAINNITSRAPELQNILNNPIQVVQRSVAELTQPLGERFDSIREIVQDLSSTSVFDDFVDNTFRPFSSSPISVSGALGQFSALPLSAFAGSRSGAGLSYSKIPNPLRNYSSFNYVITLGILSAEEYNNPSIYRTAGGFKNYVIRSGGGDYSKRYQVFDEYETQGHAEYFLDNFEMDAVIAPNPNTNVSLGTAIKFQVTEPFSMGNFIEAIIGSAADAGFGNYLDAPFCIRIDFVGWDEYGNASTDTLPEPIFVPIKITKVNFNVDGKGSVYDVEAVPMPETGLADDINQIKTPINANGDFVHTVLETSSRSVSSILNDRVAQLEEADVIAPYDRYAIVFPKSREDFRDYLDRDIINESALVDDADQAEQDRQGTNYAPELQNPAFRNAVRQRSEEVLRATIRSVGRTYAKIKTFAEDTGAMNEIGLSTLVENVSSGGNQAHAAYANSVTDPQDPRGNPQRNASGMAPADRSRDYQFNQGMTITEIIERMVLNSEFARTRATEPGQNGIRRWFKIDTYTFIESNPQTEAQIGRPPRVYVFSVIPYDADEAKFNAPNERPANTEGLKAAAAKEYNYIYTGKNEDVLDFRIEFNNAFMQTAFANFGQNAGGNLTNPTTDAAVAGVDDGLRGTQLSSGTGNGNNSATGGIQEQVNTSSTSGNAIRSGDMRRRIAEQFHDRITNQVTDMVTAEMEIFGDPFFIPQQMGNHVSEAGDRPNTSTDGTMRYQESEVFCVVNFRTPFDYQIEGATMEFPKIVPQFSGLFNIWAVTNNFNGGKFTQRIKLIRRRGQDDPATDNNTGAVQVNDQTQVGSTGGGSGDTATGNTTASTGATVSANPTTPNSTPTGQPAAASVPNPTGRRFGSIDQALNAARSYQQANPGFEYAVAQGTNGGFTIATRSESLDAFGGSGAPVAAPTATDLSSQASAAQSASTSAQPPTSPAC